MIGSRGHDPARVERVIAIKDWAREASGSGESATILVTELACSEPGCPPLETVIAVLRGKDDRLTLKLHKALTLVTEGDVRDGFSGLARSAMAPDHSH